MAVPLSSGLLQTFSEALVRGGGEGWLRCHSWHFRERVLDVVEVVEVADQGIGVDEVNEPLVG